MIETQFNYSKTFRESIRKLSNENQKRVKTSCVDFQLNGKSNALQFERISQNVDRKYNFWSIRAEGGIRIVIHKEGGSIRFMYVDHHDDAFKWPTKNRVEQHPVTGSLQTYEIIDENFNEFNQETVNDKIYFKKNDNHVFKKETLKKEYIFKHLTESQLLQIGVPQIWIKKVQELTEEDFELYLEKLPEEASEALTDIYLGENINNKIKKFQVKDIHEHPDTLRRFSKIESIEEINNFFDMDWESWLTFLHPEQRESAYKNRNGAAKVSGSAGTGKTVVSLHRAYHLAKNDKNTNILLMTYSNTLAKDLENKVNLLFKTNTNLIKKIKVSSINKEVRRLFPIQFKDIIQENQIKLIIKASTEELNINDFDIKFLLSEWNHIIDAWDIITFNEYKNFLRVGRGTQIGLLQRSKIWKIFTNVRKILEQKNMQTWNSAIGFVARHYSNEIVKPYTNVIIDEAQDLEPIGLTFLRSIVEKKENDLFFSGDLGQRIYKQSFSWLKSGVDIRGRSNHLKINYRTSKQIFKLSDLLVPDQIVDEDGNTEDRKGIVSTFDGPEPSINFFNNSQEEISKLSQWLKEITSNKVIHYEEIALLCRTRHHFDKAIEICKKINFPHIVVSNTSEPKKGFLSIMTMHRSKGLEFRAVAIFSCNYDMLPLRFALNDAEDEVEKKQIIKREEFLLYVACSRAREFLWLSSSDKPSEFIEFLNLSKDN
ncbi:AAA family ATPase [Pseudomonadota bacterium]|nr:AAA family ATPase [Pseudomonadota bacterium]